MSAVPPDNSVATARAARFVTRRFLLRPFTDADAPSFAAGVRESMATGAGLAAIAVLSQFAFKDLEQSRVEIVVAEGNVASLGLARKCGATHECLARNRLRLHGTAVAAHVFSLLP